MKKLNIPIKKSDEDRHLVFGFASAAEVVDSENDVISAEELERAVYDFVAFKRVGGDMHEVLGVATLIESFFITSEKAVLFGIEERFIGMWFVGFKVHDEEVWRRIKGGELRMMSIGMTARRMENE